MIVIGILIIGLIPYILTFYRSSLSSNPNDWGAFGGYVSGILSVVNLFIFIFLTVYISRLDEQRGVSDKSLQRKIIITQFRQSELSALDKKLDEVFEMNGSEEKYIVLHRLTNTVLLLTNFINQKGYLFPLLNDTKHKIQALNLLEKLNNVVDIIEELYGKDLDTDSQHLLETKLQTYIFLKNEFVEDLQSFILNDLR
jgi:hypothetical protein